MELRQLRYFVAVAEELNFSRAAAREHIVTSALTQQVQRLERELGVPLCLRNTHRVELTAAGRQLWRDSQLILDMIERAARSATWAAQSGSVLRVGVGDPTLDTMPKVLHQLADRDPELTIHRIEASFAEQYRMLSDGRLDVGIGRLMDPPEGLEAEVIRHDRVGVLVSTRNPLAELESIAVGQLADQLLVMSSEEHSPEYNDFVLSLCHSAGFRPRQHPGSVESLRAAADLVRHGRCVCLTPGSCDLLGPGLVWVSLQDARAVISWSLLWWQGCERPLLLTLRETARETARALGWLAGDQPGVQHP